MFRYSFVCFVLLASSSLTTFAAAAANRGSVHAISKSKYTRAHSLEEGYQFDPRDGWDNVKVTNLPYKYVNTSTPNTGEAHRHEQRANKGKKYSKHKHPKKPSSKKPNSKGQGSSSIGSSLVHVLGEVWNGLKAISDPESVIITWYTGHDLLNPSCWSTGKWHPTDASFAAALTLEGWTTRPKCFKFLEICNGPKKCVFVRVVDTCAGCAEGSKHVDLTRAAFGQLAAFGEGELTVQMRMASEPSGWFEDLWGPKQ